MKNGDYTNTNYGNGKDNGIACSIQEKTDILMINYPGHTPIIRFDGTGDISMSEVSVSFYLSCSPNPTTNSKINNIKSQVKARVTIQKSKSLGELQFETCH